MVDRSRPNRPQPPRPPAAPGPENAPEGPRPIPPANYQEHLQAEHGVRVVAEPGWPTEIKRYYLVRGENGKEERLEVYRGTLPEALAHFYRLLHPRRSRR
jgi:hypothetical protein